MNIFEYIKQLFRQKNTNNNQETEVIQVYISPRGRNTSPEEREKEEIKWRKRCERLEKKEIRFENRRKIWAIIRILISNYELQKATNRYSYKKAIEDLEQYRSRLSEYEYDRRDVEIAVRLIRLKHAQGECEAPIEVITSYDINTFSANENINLDLSQIILKSLSNEEEYWDNVLANYKRQHAKINRLQYLVDSYTCEKDNPLIQKYPTVISKVDELMIKYKDILESELSLKKATSRNANTPISNKN